MAGTEWDRGALAPLGRHLRSHLQPRRRRSSSARLRCRGCAGCSASWATRCATAASASRSARSSSSSPGSCSTSSSPGAWFRRDHATATFQQRVLWRAVWAVFAYSALVFGFGGALHARRAQRVAHRRGARAEAALVRAELAGDQRQAQPALPLQHAQLAADPDAQGPGRRRAGAAPLRADDALRARHRPRSATDRVRARRRLEFVRDYLGARVAAPRRAPEGRLADRPGDARRRRSRR